jgi:o-succinylbenzoate synthase
MPPQFAAGLDPFGLLLIEQPLDEDDLRGHAELARTLDTPVCLDESITSARAAAAAISLGACQIVNIKPGRVGGYLEARRVHDVCAAHGVPVWCGGMLETGLGRAANLALGALPGFVFPGDTSASARYYHQDITPPFVLSDGHLPVPDGPGVGVEPILTCWPRWPRTGGGCRPAPADPDPVDPRRPRARPGGAGPRPRPAGIQPR